MKDNTKNTISFKKFLYLLLAVCFLVFPLTIRAAALYLMPQSQTVYEDDYFIVDVRLNTEGEQINAVMVNLVFPDFLKVTDFNKGGSIFSLWPEEPVAKDNTFSFSGGVPQGFIGDDIILKITFKAKDTGKAEVNFDRDSKVLLNDGKGSEANIVFLEANYTILERPEGFIEIISNTHPDQNKWYNQNSFFVHWDFKEDGLYSYVLSRDPLAVPDEIPDTPEGELIWMGDMEYENLEDGIYYFHLQEAEKEDGEILVWSPKASFRIMVDTKEPEGFIPKIAQSETVFGGKYFLSFSAIDKMSGVDSYQILETKNKKQDIGWRTAQSPYLLEDQSLNSIIKIKAVDKAGNEKIVEIIPPEKPSFVFPYWIIVTAVLILTACYFLKKAKKDSKYAEHTESSGQH